MTREEEILEMAWKYTANETNGLDAGVASVRKGVLFAAFRDGAAWADQHPHWISVEDELPKRMNENSVFSDTVLVYNKDGYKDTAYYDFQEKIWRWMPSVTHWMPIVPPKKGGQQ